MLMFRLTHPVCALFLGSALLGVGFLVPMLWPLAFLGLCGWLHFLYSPSGREPARAFWWGWCAGFIFIGFAIGYLWQILPLDWLGIESAAIEWLLVFGYWGVVTLALSFFIALWFAAAAKLMRRSWVDLLILPVLWVLFEYLRMWGFALLTYGSAAALGPHFSVGFLGYLLSNNLNLLQFAQWGGVYTLSFLFVFIAVLIFAVLSRFQKTYAALLVLIVLYATLPLHSIYDETHTSEVLNVALITTTFPPSLTNTPEVLNARYALHKQLLEEIAAQETRPDIIVFPEQASVLRAAEERGELNTFLAPFQEQPTLMIDSERIDRSDNAALSRLYYFDTERGLLHMQDKHVLMPQGEYTPALFKWPLRFFAGSDVYESIQINRTYISGDAPTAPVSFKDYKVVSLFCSEILSPSLYRNPTPRGKPSILINVASQSFFGGSSFLTAQTIAAAKVHAVQNKNHFLQAGNYAPSFVINPHGRVLAVATAQVRGGEVLFVAISKVESE